jgi:DNA ligase (NAD+)
MDPSRIESLVAEIRYHQDLYYNGEAVIEDAEFDSLWDELHRLDPGNEIFSRVGNDLADGWPKARHIMPMGSQEKASSNEEFLAWAVKAGHASFMVEYKLDGASIELQYRAGSFVRAITRGDGTIGDDITSNVARMAGVPRKLNENFDGAVRGEIIMARSVHKARYSNKANCRNAANGLMKRKDGSGSSDLAIICYDAMGLVTLPGAQPARPFEDEPSKLQWLAAAGFDVVFHIILPSASKVVDFRESVMSLRTDLDFDIDGLVVKGIDIDDGDLERTRPELQIAFKFEREQAITSLLSVEWRETGSSYTPIGIVEPVRLAGTTVQRANLCNTNMITKLGLRIGCRVSISKRGEIIPKIEAVVDTPAESEAIEVPTTCTCGSSLVDEGTRLYCPNASCPKKELHRLEKWLTILDVRSFGSGILAKLHASGRVHKIHDLYSLEAEELASFERMGSVLAKKILRNLQAKRELGLAEFVAGFDIEGIGLLIVEKIVLGGFDSLEKMRKVSIPELDAIEGVAEITARTFKAGMDALGPDMDALLASGSIHIKTTLASGSLKGKSFCFTGELHRMKRSEAEALVRSLGGTIKPGVGPGLDWLVTNDTASGSSKNRRAQELKIPVIDEETFVRLVEGR